MTTRADKDLFLRTDKDSPIPAEARSTFPGLPYYEIKPEFRLPSLLTERRGEAPVIIEMQTTARARTRCGVSARSAFRLAPCSTR
jgi:uncharacterized protein (DUF1684 family)